MSHDRLSTVFQKVEQPSIPHFLEITPWPSAPRQGHRRPREVRISLPGVARELHARRLLPCSILCIILINVHLL